MLSKIKPLTTELASPVALILSRLGVKPNHLTFLGLVFALVSSYLIIEKNIPLASFFILLSSLCDLLDGALARNAGMTSNFGAFLGFCYGQIR